jgi:hypothetical protein
MNLGAGKLEKLKIIGLNSSDDKPSLDPSMTFTAYFNPESYSVAYGIEYEDTEEINASASEMNFKKAVARTFSFELVIDGTGIKDGITANPLVSTVEKKVEQFEKITYNYDGSIHRPRYLQLSWGKTLTQKVVLDSMDVTYNLFKPDGTPIRARLNCAFREVVSPELQEAMKKKSSPDLSHMRLIKEGDTLPNLCRDIYGDPSLYLEVAKANNLRRFRKLKPGQKIIFPPLIRE